MLHISPLNYDLPALNSRSSRATAFGRLVTLNVERWIGLSFTSSNHLSLFRSSLSFIFISNSFAPPCYYLIRLVTLLCMLDCSEMLPVENSRHFNG
jgi:hypothetical protein